jgi:hypothetical protein
MNALPELTIYGIHAGAGRLFNPKSQFRRQRGLGEQVGERGAPHLENLGRS